MGKRIHFFLAALIAAMLSGPQAGADTPDDPLRFFADCTGRLSAELSHLWMMASPGSDQVEGLRAATIDILEAITPEGQGRQVLSWRLQARSAHAALLSRATFRNDPWASDRAAAQIAYCASFIVGPIPEAPTTAEPSDLPPVPASQPIP